MGQRVLVIAVLLFFGLALFAQMPARQGGDDSLLPQELLRPQYGEAPRFPKDYVIGELGRGDASEESYQTAKRLLAALTTGNGTTGTVLFPERKRLSALESIKALGTRAWRIGGGRVEPDGSFSFLIRFLGREKSITGELYLRQETGPEPAGPGSAGPEVVEVSAPATSGSELSGTETAESEASAPAASEAASGPPGVRWRVDDILLESSRSLAEGEYSPGGADMTPYERFF